VHTVDYIIVGAGTAGCVLAERLSASGRRNVLLLEAGGDNRSLWLRVPVGYGRTFNDPRFNWMYETEPDAGLNGVRCYWPRGKVVGGSGSINAMVYVRGQPRDYEDWGAGGVKGWGWSDVRPVFESMEQRTDGGPGILRISDNSTRVHALCRCFIDACGSQGLAFTPDFNGAQPEGVGIYATTTRDGLRESTATAYLRPARARANLELRLCAAVRRIDLEGQRASGVSYLWRGAVHQARAARAVIVCGGTVNSPQLLQLSGIGDPALLGRIGISTHHALPAVGQHLQDHLAVNYNYRSRVPTLNNELHPWWGKVRAAIRYVLTRRGALSMSVNQAGGFIRSSPDRVAPDFQLYFNPASYATSRTRTRRLLNPDAYPGFIMSFQTCRPKSRGYLAIRSADPDVAPAIHPQYLSAPQDVADVLIGSRLLRRIASSAPLNAVIEQEMQPGQSVQSDEALIEDFRARAGSVFHPVGTCMMGTDPSNSVVDGRLRVHGLAGLRVVDASIFPNVTSGNTNGPVAMVAERAAGMVLQDETSS
jgi:choline dehydrogenase-like flavoprotein